MSAVTKLPKPQMRRLFESQVKMQLGIAFVASLVSGLAFKILVKDKRSERYANFYKDYDCQEHFERMRRRGVFDSVPAD
ncbi:cytochrome c oxidase subunit 6C-like [Lycorma delicatula]|uniref:cytochrome c oxidase subunit 6C-like n=1 Tax=Lycorma delicatula TaxID=130591 RepID=UPI003F518707